MSILATRPLPQGEALVSRLRAMGRVAWLSADRIYAWQGASRAGRCACPDWGPTICYLPGFIMAGSLMNGGGITDRIIRFASAGVGWIRGGLGLTNVAGSMLFAGISGTRLPRLSIGAVMIPGMKGGVSDQFLRQRSPLVFDGRPDHPSERADDHRWRADRRLRWTACSWPAPSRASCSA